MTSTGIECMITGDFLSCPANTEFAFSDERIFLEATLKCPVDNIQQANEASQRGLCGCDSSLRNAEQTPEEATPISCQCFACPQGSRYSFAYDCDESIFGECTRFNCFGECNGRINFDMNGFTFAPTSNVGSSFPPSDAPSLIPSDAPSLVPSFTPTTASSGVSSSFPPSDAPSLSPTVSPSLRTPSPSNIPRSFSSVFPTSIPSDIPSSTPTITMTTNTSDESSAMKSFGMLNFPIVVVVTVAIQIRMMF